MTDLTSLLSDLTHSTERLLQTLAHFPSGYFNQKPRADAWSAGDVAEHLLKIERSVVSLLSGEAIPTEHRSAEKKVAAMTAALQNREQKFSSPEMFVPSPAPKDQEAIIQKIQANRQQMALLLPNLELSHTCSNFPHPFLGHLTKWEWVYFVVHHSARHVEQLIDLKNAGERSMTQER